MVSAWAQDTGEPRAWLMYSASYLLRTGTVRWAIDPVRLQHRLPAAPRVDYASGLEPLSLVLLTHQHGDHLDLDLIRSLNHLPITWVVPEGLLRRVSTQAAIPSRQITEARPLQPIELQGVKIIPFNGMHWERTARGEGGGFRGVPALGYLVEHGGRRWLFPGDTRDYVASELPHFGPVDLLFAHLWLGRGAARQQPPPLLEAFCQWCIDLSAVHVILTHLEEFGRAPEDYWDAQHAELVLDRLRELRPALTATSAEIGSNVLL